MLYTVKEQLTIAKLRLDEALDTLKNEPELGAVSDLIEACESIDSYYRQVFCREQDKDDGVPEGSTYEEGVCLEFYIEADWWHRVSLALRELRKKNATE